MEGIITWSYYIPQPPDGTLFKYGINIKRHTAVIAVDTITRIKQTEHREPIVFAQLICSVNAGAPDVYREFLITNNHLEILEPGYEQLTSYSYRNNIFYLFAFREPAE